MAFTVVSLCVVAWAGAGTLKKIDTNVMHGAADVPSTISIETGKDNGENILLQFELQNPLLLICRVPKAQDLPTV